MIPRKPHHKQLARGKGITRGGPMKRGGRIKVKPDRKMAAWSKAVRERDGNECRFPNVRCLNRGTLHAHHIATRKRRPDLVYELSNGMTLCFIHHQWVHDHPIEAEAAGLLSSATYEAAQKSDGLRQTVARGGE